MPRTINEKRRERTKQKILDAAMKCFADKGFHSTSMQDICKAVPMSPGSLYRYFSSKDEIIIAIVELERQENEEFIQHISTDRNLINRLSEIIEYVIKTSQQSEYSQLSVEVFAELARNEEAKKVAVDSYDAAITALQTSIEQAMVRGEVDTSWDSESLAELLILIIDALETRPLFSKMSSDKAMCKTVIKLLAALKPDAKR